MQTAFIRLVLKCTVFVFIVRYMFIAASTEQIVFIRRYNMDGSNKLDIVTDDIGMVHGMAIGNNDEF